MGDPESKTLRYALVAAILAATVPVTVAINQYIARNKELALAERQRQFDMRMSFLDRAIDPKLSPDDRQEVLRFLLATVSETDPIRTWADGKLEEVAHEIDVLKERDKERQSAIDATERLDRRNRELQNANTKFAVAQANYAALRRSNTAPRAQLQTALEQMAEAAAQKKLAEVQFKEAQANPAAQAKSAPRFRVRVPLSACDPTTVYDETLCYPRRGALGTRIPGSKLLWNVQVGNTTIQCRCDLSPEFIVPNFQGSVGE